MRENFSKLTKTQLQKIIDDCTAEIETIKKKLKNGDLSEGHRKLLNDSMKKAGDRLTNAKKERDKPVRKNRHPGRRKKN